MPQNDDTPPRGSARVKPMTEHAMIDLGELGMRTADKVQELGTEWRDAKPIIAEIPAMKVMLELALRPTIKPHAESVSRAIIGGAIGVCVLSACAVIFVIALVVHVSITPAFASVPKVEQHR